MHKNLILIIFFGLSIQLFAQTTIISPDTLCYRLWEQTRLFPQEKLYLSTDKPTYVCGENIWFRAFVVNAISHKEETASRYVYVELVNPFDSVVCRVKTRQDSLLLIHGHVPLDEELPSGDYYLRAYTRYMMNNSDSCFFRKSVHVASPLEKSICIESQFESGSATLRFLNPVTRSGLSLNSISVSTGKEELRYKKDNDIIRFNLKAASLPHKFLLVKAGNYKRFIPVSIPVSEYDVDFLPEGGRLLQGFLCKVGFKALNDAGLGENITGTLLDNDNRAITSIKSLHRGMGYFSFIPQAGKNYFVECTNEVGLSKKFQLPAVQSKGYDLQVHQRNSMLYVSVLGVTPASSDSLFLLIHQKGLPRYVEKWDAAHSALSLRCDDLFAGVAHLLLLDGQGVILSERMVFINNSQTVFTTLVADKAGYQPRERVGLNFTLFDNDGVPMDGNFSIAVTDNHDVQPDSCTTILSTLLLSSDIRGYVEDANWYFRHTNRKEADEALDVLLLTQGWRKYNLANVLCGKYRLPQFPAEENMEIRGRVMTPLTGRSAKHCIVKVAAPAQGMVRELEPDLDGRFLFNGFEFPDSTAYAVATYSLKKRDKHALLLVVDEEVFPRISYPFPLSIRQVSSVDVNENQQYLSAPSSVDLLTKASNRLFYEQGIRHIFLDEVIVTARKKIEYKTIYQRDASKTLTHKDIKESGLPNIGFLVASKANLVYTGTGLLFMGGGTAIYLDGVYQDLKGAENILRNLSPSDIEQIDVIKGKAACIAYGNLLDGFPDAIVAITTRRGEDIVPLTATNATKIYPLGYQQPVDFYSPKYETLADHVNDKPDLRTTIYWKPDVIVEDGKATLSFYTADTKTTYSAVIEGVSKEGKLYRVVRQLKVDPQ